MAKININRQSYWEECIDAFNKAIDDNKFSATFKKLDKNKDIHKDSNTGRVKEWIDVLTSATTGMFNLSFNICDDTAKIDLYFFNNKYDIKKSRDAFLKKYNDTYNSSTQFQPGKDKNNKDSENPDARVRFVKSDKIQSGNYTDAIDWQIDTLVNTYNNILNLNQEMINNSEYPLALTVSNLSEEKLLQEFVNWLKKKSISSANQYLTPLQGKNKTLILNYLSKSSILDITKEDCDKIFDNASSVFQGLNDPTNYKTYIKHFGTYLQENNNGGSSISESQTTMIYKMLDENKQVILTGAPGTGKTFTVKEYVEGKEFKFVQFLHLMTIQTL